MGDGRVGPGFGLMRFSLAVMLTEGLLVVFKFLGISISRFDLGNIFKYLKIIGFLGSNFTLFF